MPHNTPEKRKEYYRQYNILNSEKRKKQRLAKRDERIKYCKEWNKKNKNHVIAYRKKIYAENIRCMGKYRRGWYNIQVY